MDDRARAKADSMRAEDPDPHDGLCRMGAGEDRLTGLGLLLRAIVAVVAWLEVPPAIRWFVVFVVARSGPGILAWAGMGVGLARRLGLGLGGQVKPLEDGRGLESAG